METLETSLETIGTSRLSVRPKWKQKWKHFPKRKHLTYSTPALTARNELRCSTGSIGLTACINSNGVRNMTNKYMTTKQVANELEVSVGNCVQVGA
jgi:hypothetical protein